MKAAVSLLIVVWTSTLPRAQGFTVRSKFANRSNSRSGCSDYRRPQSPNVHVHVPRHRQRQRHRALKTGQQEERERPTELKFISILSESGMSEQMLPVASASSFPLWVLESDEVDHGGRKKVTQIPGANAELGWVNPRSYGDVWVPEGSPAPTMKLCLGMLLKDGVPRYVMPMVDLVVSKEGRKWRNRGLNSVPVAHTWEPVERAASGSLFISVYMEEKVEGSEIDSMWGTLAERVPVTDAFTDIVSILADPPDGLDLGSGFHFLVSEVAVAGAGTGTGAVLAEATSGSRVRVYLTDLADPAGLLDVEELGASGGAPGVAALKFDVVSVASGAESEFLPEVYRPFFTSDGEP